MKNTPKYDKDGNLTDIHIRDENDKLHCVTSPANAWPDDRYPEDDGWYHSWWFHGNQHRYYGPSNSHNYWHIHNVRLK